MPTKDDPRITVRLDWKLYDMLNAACEQRGISIGEMAREALLAHTQPRVMMVNETRTVVPASREVGEIRTGSTTVEGSTCPKCNMGTVRGGKCTNCRKVF